MSKTFYMHIKNEKFGQDNIWRNKILLLSTRKLLNIEKSHNNKNNNHTFCIVTPLVNANTTDPVIYGIHRHIKLSSKITNSSRVINDQSVRHYMVHFLIVIIY